MKHLLQAMMDSGFMYCNLTLHPGDKVEKALDAIRHINYNGFKGAEVAEWVKSLLANGFAVQIGREYSMVMYVTVPHLVNHNLLTPSQEAKMAQQVMRKAKSLKADEIGLEKRSPVPQSEHSRDTLVVRAWWD